LDFPSPPDSEVSLGFDWDVPNQILALETWQTTDFELAALAEVVGWIWNDRESMVPVVRAGSPL
jgi:hypothetical protein